MRNRKRQIKKLKKQLAAIRQDRIRELARPESALAVIPGLPGDDDVLECIAWLHGDPLQALSRIAAARSECRHDNLLLADVRRLVRPRAFGLSREDLVVLVRQEAKALKRAVAEERLSHFFCSWLSVVIEGREVFDTSTLWSDPEQAWFWRNQLGMYQLPKTEARFRRAFERALETVAQSSDSSVKVVRTGATTWAVSPRATRARSASPDEAA